MRVCYKDGSNSSSKATHYWYELKIRLISPRVLVDICKDGIIKGLNKVLFLLILV
jgi:hypothetical protein